MNAGTASKQAHPQQQQHLTGLSLTGLPQTLRTLLHPLFLQACQRLKHLQKLQLRLLRK